MWEAGRGIFVNNFTKDFSLHFNIMVILAMVITLQLTLLKFQVVEKYRDCVLLLYE